jgi:hypothetical protein
LFIANYDANYTSKPDAYAYFYGNLSRLRNAFYGEYGRKY